MKLLDPRKGDKYKTLFMRIYEKSDKCCINFWQQGCEVANDSAIKRNTNIKNSSINDRHIDIKSIYIYTIYSKSFAWNL